MVVGLAGLDGGVGAGRVEADGGDLLVERAAGEVELGEAGHQLGRDLGQVERGRHAVEQAHPLQHEQRGARRDGQLLGLVEVGRHHLVAQHGRAGRQAHLAGGLGERLQAVGPLTGGRSGAGRDIPAAAVGGAEDALFDQRAQRLAQGDPADAEPLAQFALGGSRPPGFSTPVPSCSLMRFTAWIHSGSG